MAGTYWLTVLPDTSKLDDGIKSAMRRIDRGLKITPQFDTASADRAGREAGTRLQRGIESSGAGRLGRLFSSDGAEQAGRKAGSEVDRGLKAAGVGKGLGKQVSDELNPGAAQRAGENYGRKVGDGVERGASGGLKRLTVALGALGIGSAVSQGLKSAMSAGMEFTTNLNTMGAVSNATAAQLGEVSAKARQLGSDAQLPGVSAQSAAAAMTELAKGGFSVKESMEAARGTLQLAGAANVDGATAATIQADALHTFGLKASDAGRAADMLAGAANGSSVEIQDIAQSLAAGGSVANGFGISLKDTASTIGMFGNMGIKGSDAGTSLKTALLQLTSSSKPVVGAFEELGVKAFDSSGKFVGMRTLMGQLSDASKRMTQEQYQSAAATAFGTDGVRLAMLAAQQGTKGFDDMSAAVGRAGVASEVAAARTRGLPGAWNNFKNQLDGVKLALYDKLQGPLAVVLNYASSAIEKLMPVLERGASKIGSFFEQYAPAIKTFGAAIAAAFSGDKAGGGELMKSLGSAAKELGPALKDVGPTIKSLAGSIGELGSGALSGIVVPAIRLLAGALKFAADNASWLGPILAGLLISFGALKVANGAAGNLRVLGESMANLFTPVTLIASIAQTRALNAHTAALNRLTGAQNASAVSMARQRIAAMASAVATGVMTVATNAAAVAQRLFNLALTMNPIGLIIAAVVAIGVAIWAFFTKTETGRKLWDKIWNGIKAAVDFVINWFKNTALPWLAEAWENIKAGWNTLTSSAEAVWNGVKEKFTNMVNFVKELPSKIADGARGMWDGIGNAFKSVVNGMIRVWNSFASKLSFTTPSWVPGLGGKTFSIPTIPEFASGGYTGPGGKYDPAGIVHAGEFVLRKEATARLQATNPGALERLNSTGRMPGYADGGLVTPAQLSSFAQGVEGRPYVWGGTNWGDCSGAVSALANYATGRDPFSSRFGTASESSELAQRGFKPGLGPAGSLNVGWFNGGPYGGHTAATLPDGTNFEMGGARGNGQYGGQAAGANDSSFTDHAHLPPEFFTGMDAGSPTTGGGSLGGAVSSSGGSSSGGSGGGSSVGGSVSSGRGGASSASLSAAANKTSSAETAKKNADQSVSDHEYRLDRAKKDLDELQAKKHTAKQLEAAQRRVDVADRELTDAKERQTKAADKLTTAQQAEADLKTKGASGDSTPGSGGADTEKGPTGADFGKTFMGGVMETIGLDGSVFGNPFELPNFKSLMAGVNFAGALAKAKAGQLGGATTPGAGGGFIDGAAGSLGLDGFLKNIPGIAGLPSAGASVAGSPTSAATQAPVAAPAGGAVIDQSINMPNAGVDPYQMRTEMKREQNSRARTYTGKLVTS